MKKLLCVGFVSFSILIISGCATTPTASSSAKGVSSERMYSKDYFIKTDERNTPVTIIRDGGIWGAACIHRVYINNKKVFALKPNERATVYLSPQEYEIKVDLAASSFCPYSQVEEMINLEPNSQHTYRIASTLSVNEALQLIKVN
ncbi:hypothetical protein [Acinetobacter sp. ANC 3903]|uniref:hypothetical protein n=1 Tax=Acinetobacter sp. ANC 3903 TaxID=1977883 RepID=UPI001177CC01|nr:hypothetical protein [Acinetobacter sp. ANC 3903]